MCIYKTRHKCVNYRISTLCNRCKISTKLQSNNNKNKNNNNNNNNYNYSKKQLSFSFSSWVSSFRAVVGSVRCLPLLSCQHFRQRSSTYYTYTIYIYLHTISLCILYAWLLRVISPSLTERYGGAIGQSIESVMYISIMTIGSPSMWQV